MSTVVDPHTYQAQLEAKASQLRQLLRLLIRQA